MRDKRLVIICSLMIILSTVFWTVSRYPALDDKSVMGADTSLSGIGFDTLFYIAPDTNIVLRIVFTSINWLYTNIEGMSFGLLFGVLMMMMLPLIKRRISDNRIINTLLGVIMGIPLGVCVNCAAPIAKAIHDVNGRTETMLATMLSSPTLNVIVITMMFALFPFYIVLIKLVLTLTFILIAIPLLARWLPLTASRDVFEDRQFYQPSSAVSLQISQQVIDGSGTWLSTLAWTTKNFSTNLWALAKTTLPLMFLAGLLGSALIVIIPLETLVDVLPTKGRYGIIAGLVLVATIGIFLPVPITFDVIIAAALWQAGLPIQYVMALLFTLGIFSVFPFLVVWNTLGFLMASTLLSILTLMGIASGVLAYWGHELDSEQQQRIVFEYFSQTADPGPTIIRTGQKIGEEQDYETIVASLTKLEPVLMPSQTHGEAIDLRLLKLNKPDHLGEAKHKFQRFDGSEFGIGNSSTFSINKFEGPFPLFRGIATGDVQNDGWSDLLLTYDTGIFLYVNQSGLKFVHQRIDIPEIQNANIMLQSLVDLDSDGWLDIFISTFRQGDYIIYNSQGDFIKKNMRHFPTGDSAMTGAAAFADIDRDGDLDIVTGSWTPAKFHGIGAMRTNSRVHLQQPDGQFVTQLLPQTPGQRVLSILLSDINLDGNLDLVIGGEDIAPDTFMLGRGTGLFDQIPRQDGIIPHSAGTTMSVTSADVNNDLKPEIFVGQIAVNGDTDQRPTSPSICEEITDSVVKADCQNILEFHTFMPSQKKRSQVNSCLSLDRINHKGDCIAYALLMNARQNGPLEQCLLLPDSREFFRSMCVAGFNGGGPLFSPENRPYTTTGPNAEYWNNATPVILNKSVLLSQFEDEKFRDVAEEMNVSDTGFTWNAKFADLDNDEFVDLFIVNGWFPSPQRESNLYFRNRAGKKFINQTEDVGLTSFLATSAYSYADIDNDGDLDIITAPIVGPVSVYVNNSINNRIVFQLRDQLGNSFGIGSKVTIFYGDDGKQQREILASGGFISFDAPDASFGLGRHQSVNQVVVDWSTGERSEIRNNFAAGTRYSITRTRPKTELRKQQP